MSKKKANALKEQTIKMYDDTISEMIEKGATDEEIEIVKKAKEEMIAAYDYEAPVKPKRGKLIQENRELVNVCNIQSVFGVQNQDIEPLMDNLFIIHIDNVPIYIWKSVNCDENKKMISLFGMEIVGFSPKDYFAKKNKFDKIEIEYINREGKTLKVEVFEKVKVKSIQTGWLSYESDGRPIKTNVIFEYKKKNVPTTN